jgi:tetratricopeptide (TPR) repeat protein
MAKRRGVLGRVLESIGLLSDEHRADRYVGVTSNKPHYSANGRAYSDAKNRAIVNSAANKRHSAKKIEDEIDGTNMKEGREAFKKALKLEKNYRSNTYTSGDSIDETREARDAYKEAAHLFELAGNFKAAEKAYGRAYNLNPEEEGNDAYQGLERVKHEHERKRLRGGRLHTLERHVRNYQKTAATAAIIGIVGAFVFLSPKITGNVIGVSASTGNLIGVGLFLVGLFATMYWFRGRKS